MKAVLIYPPITDPTCGYLSLCYLASYVRSRREYQVKIIDANIEALDFCAQPEEVAGLLRRAGQKLERLRYCTDWSPAEKELYYDILHGGNLEPKAPTQAIATMKDPERFWDYSAYHPAALALRRWLRLLSTDGVPGEFEDFSISERISINLCNLEKLTHDGTLNRLCAPFFPYVHGRLLLQLAAEDPAVIGIGVTYHEQLPFALYIAREARRALGQIRIVMGGTDISQVWKYSRTTRSFGHMFRFADAFVIGEGESSFLSLLDAYATGSEPTAIPSVLTEEKFRSFGKVVPHYEDLDALTSPMFEDLPWHLYFSPKQFVYYAPTRGCYWDKCTFCDYGLAGDRPTSPWRQRSLEKVVEDLSCLSRVRDPAFVYLSVDVIAPAFLVKLAQRIVQARIKILWGAELRLERYFTPAHCELLRESGCIGISVGFESGNQRVLDLMDKGTKVEEVRQIVRSFANAGIAVQIMGFTDFPTETYEEALDSVRVLQELRSNWVFGGLGKFKLTAGAIVAKAPNHFGLVSVQPRVDDDIHCFLECTESTPSKKESEKGEIDRQVAAMRHPFELPRPFVGGTDTAHTYFYFARFGTQTRTELDKANGMNRSGQSNVRLFGQVVAEAPFDLSRLPNQDKHFSPEDGAAFPCLLLDDGRVVRCSKITVELAPFLDGRYTLDELEVLIDRHFGSRSVLLLGHLHQLISAQLVRFEPPSEIFAKVQV